jgi:hypothetical protein
MWVLPSPPPVAAVGAIKPSHSPPIPIRSPTAAAITALGATPRIRTTLAPPIRRPHWRRCKRRPAPAGSPLGPARATPNASRGAIRYHPLCRYRSAPSKTHAARTRGSAAFDNKFPATGVSKLLTHSATRRALACMPRCVVRLISAGTSCRWKSRPGESMIVLLYQNRL